MNRLRFIFVAFALCVCYILGNAQSYTLNEQWVSCGNSCKLLDPYYSDGVTFEWTGGCVNGKVNGFGKALKYNNGVLESTYEGEYKNGIREGRGKYTTHPEEISYEGTFINGQLVGKGRLTADDGQVYEGEFINYVAHGVGKVKFGNGTVFEGIVRNKVPYTGKVSNYDGQTFYLQGGNVVDKIQNTKRGYIPKIGVRQTEYFDKDWNRCQPKAAAYYRVITYQSPHKPKGKVKDYYIDGQLQSEYTSIYIDYEDENMNFYEGEATWYYKSGKIEQKRYYYNNEINGPNTSYYEDGTIKSIYNYEYGILNGTSIENYPNGSPRIVANYENGVLVNNKHLEITEDGSPFLVYTEDFVKNHDSWEYNGVNGALIVNSDNTISLQVNPGRTVSGGIYTGFSPNGDNIISLMTHRKSKDENIIGLLFGFKDWDNYSGVFISGGQYAFQYVRNGRQLAQEIWKNSPAIETEINTLSVMNNGNSTTIYINNEQIEEFERLKYEGSTCCVTAANQGEQECQFDAAALTVSELVNPDDIPSEYLPKQPQKDGWSANGSGFFISEKGYVATNYHVIDGAKAIEVSIVRNGEWEHHPAKVILSDKQNDLSILKIDDANFTPLPSIPYNFTTRIKDTGSEVFTLGYPIANVMGEEVKFTDGKISSKTGIQGDVTVYQISVPIQPGNSGGPLFDTEGNLVGITSSGLNRDYFKSENVNYAIKSSYLKALVDAMPQPILLQDRAEIADKPLTEKIKLFQSYMTYIKVK